jgi:hypothetical protein
MNAPISGAFPLFAHSSGGIPFAYFPRMITIQFFLVLVFHPESKGMHLEEVDTWHNRRHD